MNITLSFNQVGFYMLIEPINTKEDSLKTFFYYSHFINAFIYTNEQWRS